MKITEQYAEISGGDLLAVIEFVIGRKDIVIGEARDDNRIYFFVKEPTEKYYLEKGFTKYPDPIGVDEVLLLAQEFIDTHTPLYMGDHDNLIKSFTLNCIMASDSDYIVIEPEWLSERTS